MQNGADVCGQNFDAVITRATAQIRYLYEIRIRACSPFEQSS